MWPLVMYSNYFEISEAIDTDRSVALTVAKVSIDTDRWKVRKRKCLLTLTCDADYSLIRP